MNFSGWRGTGDDGALSDAPQPSAETCTRQGGDVHDPLMRINRLCQGAEAHKFLKPLSGVLMAIGEVLRLKAVSSSVAAKEIKEELNVALEFLAGSENPARHLEFALSAQSDEAPSRRFFTSIERVLAHIAKEPFGSPLEALLPQWRREATAFMRSCREVWELHTYFVLLDVKGDRVLFEQVALQLCRMLGCTARLLVSNFEYTRPWVEEALRSLANRKLAPMLERLHADALRQWQSAWRDRIEQLPERRRFSEEAQQRGREFWDSYFTHLFKITWPDFVEAFEHFYLLCRCPLDVMCELRLRADPKFVHIVSRATWQNILDEFARIPDLVDTLVNEVLEDISSRIYRPAPLRSLVRPRPRASQPEAGGMEDPAHPSSSSSTNPTAEGEADSGSAQAGSRLAVPQKPKPWFPFAHNMGDDGDMAIPTPHDIRVRQGANAELPLGADVNGQQPKMSWDDFVARLCAQSRQWWGTPGEAPALEDASVSEPLRIAALRTVSSSIAYTHRALIFRVVSGDLAQNMPILETPKNGFIAAGLQGDVDPYSLPALVVTANGTRFGGVTKFGRSSSRRTLLPDCPMSEPIASRSHFNVVYEQESDRYYLMDAGSKWGTFVKVGSSVTLSCGDWIRVGGVEFIIRYCGGGCDCKKNHAHYRLHSLRLLRDHQGSRKPSEAARALRRQALEDSHKHSRSAADVAGLPPDTETEPGIGNVESSPPLTELGSRSVFGSNAATSSDSSEDDQHLQLQDELLMLLSSRRPRGWTPASARLFQKAAVRDAGIPKPVGASERSSTSDKEVVHAQVDGTSLFALQNGAGGSRPPKDLGTGMSSQSALPTEECTMVPIAPLELDFISGPRMGEKLVLNERVCTLGRGEGNTIQVSDSQLASVSRVHCIFEYRGNRWHMRDNGSTNGTWRRLSCVLEPSEPIPLHGGVSIQAGVHEFLVEEVEMRHWWLPSAALASFEELCEQERRDRKLAPLLQPTAAANAAGDTRTPLSPVAAGSILPESV